MTKLLMLVGITLLLAYLSQKEILVFKISKNLKLDVPLIAIIVILTFFCGLRTDYNDTYAYHWAYRQLPTLGECLDEPFVWTEYPLFRLSQCFFKQYISSAPYLYFFCASAFSIIVTIRFMKKYVPNFVFGMLMFFATDLFIFNLSAAKQCIAMAFLMIALEQFFKKRYLIYYIIVAVAILFHTYAVVFLVLPILCHKPWTITTYALVCGVAVLMLVFESFITGFLSAADDIGKTIYEGEVVGAVGMNPLRVLVFAIPTIMSFLFQKQVDAIYDNKHMLFMNMNIIFCLINCMGIINAANMFGRAATYFAMGMIVSLPKMLDAIFEEKTYRMISTLAGVCYVAFFLYDNMDFDAGYRALTFSRFIELI